MKAITWTHYGPPEILRLEEVEKPVPKDNEILIKIHASTVTLGDCELRSMSLPFPIGFFLRLYMGYSKPKRTNILGQELAGEIEAIGKNVTNYKVGQQIFAPCDMKMGAYAEYKCLPAKHTIGFKPKNMSFEEAATIPTGGLNGIHFINKAKIQSGESVLIIGAGGSIGTYSLQIAKYLGAEITCIDSGLKLDMLKELGADHVINYTKEDFTKSGKSYDVIIDIVGKNNYADLIKSLNKKGRLVLGNPTFPSIFKGLWTSIVSKKNVLFELAAYRPDDFKQIIKLIEEGQVKSVIDKQYPLEQVPDAHRYVDQGLKKGNLVINVIH